jgi:hypothetical protein
VDTETHIGPQFEKQVLDLGASAALTFGFLGNFWLVLGDGHIANCRQRLASSLVSALSQSPQRPLNQVGCVLQCLNDGLAVGCSPLIWRPPERALPPIRVVQALKTVSFSRMSRTGTPYSGANTNT